MKTNSVQFFNEAKIKTVCSKCELILAAWEVKNPSNIGHIIRLAHNAGAKKVLFAGDFKDYRKSKIKKTAGFSWDQMDWQFISPEIFFKEVSSETELIILETCGNSLSIFDTKLPQKAMILAGNEIHGLPGKIIKHGKLNVHIPMPGGCKSMNISHALSVAAFEWYRQHSF
ncbi:MAG: TrmH family RNA methyltransferase [Prolixibacteraceae bacterium]